MPKDWYPSVNEISLIDWHDLWGKALKALTDNKSPHVEPKVELPARQLLVILEMIRSKVR